MGIRLHFDVDVKILLNFDVDGTNVKTTERVGSDWPHADVAT